MQTQERERRTRKANGGGASDGAGLDIRKLLFIEKSQIDLPAPKCFAQRYETLVGTVDESDNSTGPDMCLRRRILHNSV